MESNTEEQENKLNVQTDSRSQDKKDHIVFPNNKTHSLSLTRVCRVKDMKLGYSMINVQMITCSSS